MVDCQICGKSLKTNASFCGNCGNATQAAPPVPDAGTFKPPSPPDASDTPAPAPPPPVPSGGFKPPSTAPDGSFTPSADPDTAQLIANAAARAKDQGAPFRLAHDEVLKAIFPTTRMRRPFGIVDASVYVTDSRVVYLAEAKNMASRSVDAQELQIVDVAGFRFEQRRGVGPIAAMIALFLVLAALVVKPVALIPLLIVIGIWVFISLHSAEMGFAIQGRNLSDGGILLMSRASATRARYSPVVALWPLLKILAWLGFVDAPEARLLSDPKDARAMFDAIGALVLDLQARGVLGAGELP